MVANTLERHPSILFAAMALMSAVGGVALARGQESVSLPLVALAGLASILLMFSVPPPTLFICWFFLAPLLANATGSPIGKPIGLAFYALPALVLAIVTATHLRRNVSLTFVDFLPAAYMAYVLTSIVVTSPVIEPTALRSVEVVFLNVLLGPCLYYFLVVGPGTAVEAPRLFFLLMVGSCIQGILALFEKATAWNVWGYHDWSSSEGGLRAVSTFSNPALLGAYLGIGIVSAVTILTWGGPRSLHRLSTLTLIVCIPALFATLTRGPVLATTLAALLVLVLGRKRLLGIGLIACATLALAVAWPHIRSSSVYQERASNIETVLVRQEIQRVSFELWRKKPVLGWGFDSFDRAKSSADFPYVPGLPGNIYLYAQENTSHNTYLTTLVELGLVGLLLLIAPFAVIVARAIARARQVAVDRWIVAAAGGSLLIVVLDGMTLDYRFFSFVPALSFVMLAILRRVTGGPGVGVVTTDPA